MATTTKAKADKAEPAEAAAPEPEAHPGGWAHDWRNPDAKFAASDRCVDAELARQDRG
jgi:hypothetical protein